MTFPFSGELDWMVTILYCCSAQVQAIVKERETEVDRVNQNQYFNKTCNTIFLARELCCQIYEIRRVWHF
jgi:hypothetical protein